MNQQVKTKRDFPYVTLILIVTLVLVVAILGYTFVESVGIIGRLDNAAKSNTMKLNEKELDVYRFHVAQNQLYTEFLYYQYGLMQDTTGITKLFSNGYEYANYMLPNYVGSEAFDASAYAYAEQYLAYCEGAKEAGLYDQYKDEVAADIEEYIEGLKETAKANGVTFNKYLTTWIGKGMTVGIVESAMEYYFIGGKYAEKLHKDYADAATDTDIENHIKENKDSFYSSKYISYKLVNDTMKEAIEKCKTADEVKIVIVDHYLTQKFDAQYKSKITDKKIEDPSGKDKTKADIRTTLLVLNELADKDVTAVFTDKDTDAYKKAAYEIASTINTNIKTEIAKVRESSAKWSDPTATTATDLQKWLFGEGRKKDDFTLIKSETKDKDGKVTATTYTWYIVVDPLDRDNEKTKDAYYVLLSDDKEGTEGAKTAAQKAEEFYNALKDAKTPEKFAELVEKYAPGYSAELSEQISHASIKSSSEEFADWLYEDGRAKGDIVSIPVKNDSKDKEKVTGYIIAMFEKENEETWRLTGRNAIADEKLEAWFEEAVKKYNVVIDYEPETTAATTTAKPTETTGKKPEATEPTTEKATEPTTEAPTEAGTEAPTEAPTEAQ